jgi:hypothetical protein
LPERPARYFQGSLKDLNAKHKNFVFHSSHVETFHIQPLVIEFTNPIFDFAPPLINFTESTAQEKERET